MSDLTIVTVAYNDNNIGLFDYMIKSVLKYTDPEPNFIICDNGNNDLDKYKKMSNFTIVPNSSKHKGSLQHGESLNKVLNLIKTPRFAIIESDCVVLKKDWDKIDMSRYKLLAAKKGELGGRAFYHICFLLGSTRLIRDHFQIDFRPGKDGKRTNRSYHLSQDVGWQIGKYIAPNQVKLLDFIDCKTGKGAYFDSRFQSDEFWANNTPIVAHFGRGSNIGGKAIRKGFEHPRKQLDLWKNILNDII